jgi:cytochrome oxidase Cu insertion factor (SCO1/SenC/PrrC family)
MSIRAIAAVTLLSVSLSGTGAQGGGMMQAKAPELDGGLAWFNTDGKAVKIADLKGKIVLLDFWTFC